jgi:hypothetical protein
MEVDASAPKFFFFFLEMKDLLLYSFMTIFSILNIVI